MSLENLNDINIDDDEELMNIITPYIDNPSFKEYWGNLIHCYHNGEEIIEEETEF